MAARPPRSNEYFVPKDGIDREVITADICRYLGNDALVRPGTYEAMIADLKADSERWEAERRQAAASRGAAPNGTFRDSDDYSRRSKSNTPIVEYRSSTTHHSRQYYGPTSDTSPVQGYAPPPGNGQPVYENVQYQQPPPPQQYQQQPGYGQPVAYPPPQGYPPIQDNNYYIAGADMPVAADRRPPQGAGNVPVPRSASQYPPTSQPYQGDGRAAYYPTSSAPPLTSSGQYAPPPPPQDAFYARDPSGPADYNSPEPMYDSRQQYQDPATGYAPVSLSSTTPPLPATAGGAPRHRNERDDRDRRDHRRR
ncbi:hypothetical protein F5884DRAFT_873530 [Xylogone sp. PMI_703]|nr:hypothetical protein F5884DRAFT_873530 [Xylogone sp. PMI_703]